jgi:hypothetical protein
MIVKIARVLFKTLLIGMSVQLNFTFTFLKKKYNLVYKEAVLTIKEVA